MSDPLDVRATSNLLNELAGNRLINDKSLRQGLHLIGAFPSGKLWKRFIDVGLLALSAAFMTSGVVFFFAFNWASMHRYLKLGLIGSIILALVIFASIKRLNVLSAKISLFAASFLVGALLTVISQSYQSGGADPYRLFLGWAALILGWAIAGSFTPIWFLLIMLVNVGLILYWGQALTGPDISMYLTLFGINGLATLVWELSHHSTFQWLKSRWTPRLFSLIAALALIVPSAQYFFESSFGSREPNLGLAPVAFILFSGSILYYYSRQLLDLFILTVGSFGIIAVVTSLLISRLNFGSSGELLFMGLAIIAQAGLAVSWLRKVDVAWAESHE